MDAVRPAELRRRRDQLRRHPLLEDVLLSLTFAAVAVVSTVSLVLPFAPAPPPVALVVVWAIAYMAPLALRRRWPLTVLVVMTAHFCGYWAVGAPNEFGSWVGLGAAAYSAAAYGRPGRAQLVCAGCLAAVIVAVLLDSAGEALLGPAQVVGAMLFASMPFVLGWPMGSVTRRLREYRTGLEERNAELAGEREAGAQRAVLRERVRIAQELHDVVAYHVSVMAVQAGAARRLFHTRPADAVQAISAVEEAGRAAIVDLQQLVGVLREEEPRDLAPQPSMAQLPRLIAAVQQAGLPVTLTVEGRRQPLPAGLELSAFRIVQEALTNTIKHAGASAADVFVRYRDGSVEVEVLDDGRNRAASGAASVPVGHAGGKGLLGMRERVTVYGGSLDAGPRAGGGYRVRARLRSVGT